MQQNLFQKDQDQDQDRLCIGRYDFQNVDLDDTRGKFLPQTICAGPRHLTSEMSAFCVLVIR